MPRLHPSEYLTEVAQHPRNRYVCCRCPAMATWFYMPSSERNDRAFCDEHVTRGCSCTQSLMDDGRERPCIEYEHSDEGFPLPKPGTHR